MRYMNIGSVVLIINAAVFSLYGVSFVLAPELMSQLVTGGVPATSSGVIDMRATYGGMSMAVGTALFLFGVRRELTSTGLFLVLAVMLGMAGGRLVGIFLDGAANQFMYGYLALEFSMAAVAGTLILRGRNI